jgi:DNA-binding FrmR family transcriptional regulator
MDKKCVCSERTKIRDAAEKKSLINRLSRIEGQVRGIKGMIEADAYCPDVLNQISATSAALSSLMGIMLKEHINTCVLEDIKAGRENAAEELAELISKLCK